MLCFLLSEMGFESPGRSGLPELGKHKRSKSFPESEDPRQIICVQCSVAAREQPKLRMGNLNGSVDPKKKQLSNAEIRNSLTQEVLLLKEILNDQVIVRGTLENALSCEAASRDAREAAIPESATELKEISVLEVEVGRLEQHLLLLYRKVFDQLIPSLRSSKIDRELKSLFSMERQDFSSSDIASPRVMSGPRADLLTEYNSNRLANCPPEDKHVDSSGQSLYQSSGMANKASPPTEALRKALRACHSQPISIIENTHQVSLAEHLGPGVLNLLPETPNKLSEDMIKCMSDIYCKLAEPPVTNQGLLSPTSFLSSTRAFSLKYQRDKWSPGSRKDSSFDVWMDSPFHVEEMKDFSGLYRTMFEIQRVNRNSQKLGATEYLLQNFRTLVSRLENIDPRDMTHEEKLAFWINVHNALVMHAYLAYDLPQNDTKRMSLLSKAAYNVGGHIVSADFIQRYILGCQISCPGQWLKFILSSRRLKPDNLRREYAIKCQEPLLYFALSSGSHSDPPVRVYTPRRVFQELESAKEDYIRATISIQKDHKIHLPKIVETFAKDSGLSTGNVMEMIQQSLPESVWKSIKHPPGQNIKWTPHNFAFRYVIFKELLK